MSRNFEDINCGKEVAPWLQSAAFNNYYTYSYISRSAFFAAVNPEYHSFMNRHVQNWLWWYDGYVPYFHNAQSGIPSSRLATALVNKAAQKVVGGRIMFKNAGTDNTRKEKLNPALKFISTDWAKKANFEEVIKKVATFAASAGTALLKLNRDSSGELWADALRFDSFIPTVDARGNVIEVKCFLKLFTNLGNSHFDEGQQLEGYYLVEHRYFGDYIRFNGDIISNVPIAEYSINHQAGEIASGAFVSKHSSERISFKDLPRKIRKAMSKAYPDIIFDDKILLPFKDSLGVELVKWTSCVSSLPELPFGESFLSNIVSDLMSWDYYKASANTDMYLGRGRVIAPKQITGVGSNNQYNTGLDSFIFTQWQSSNPDAQKPIPIQFDLRASQWTEIRTRLIQDIAINTHLNVSTIASFIGDNVAKTAREISTEENETAEFVNDKRAIIEKPINRLLKLVTEYYGYEDTVEIRWSCSGLTNRYALAELITTALNGGFLSQKKAVEMFNYDDDDAQVQEEYEAIINSNSIDDSIGADEGFDDEVEENDDIKPSNITADAYY